MTWSSVLGALAGTKPGVEALVARPTVECAATNLRRSRAMSSVRRALLVLLKSMRLMVAGGAMGGKRRG